MSEFEIVKRTLKMVWKHKLGRNIGELSRHDWDVMAEAAVKSLWLIEHENNKPGVE